MQSVGCGRIGRAYPTYRRVALLFDEAERGPSDDLRVYFEAIEELDRAERKVVKEVLDALLLKHDAKKWTTGG